MKSTALKSFEENSKDVSRLSEIHGELTVGGPGRKYGVEVLNKSAVVLVTAIWEAYCEDLAAEALAQIVREAPDSTRLPLDLRKQISADLKANLHELSVWEVADEGWRGLLASRLKEFQKTRNWDMNTPKADNIDTLFKVALGLTRVSNSWKWQGMSVVNAKRKLDRFVTLRGAIAHRGSDTKPVNKDAVDSYLGHVKRLVDKTAACVGAHVQSAIAP